MSDQLIQLIFAALASLIALSVHEYFHAFVAYKLGDPTARSCGRLTLNPLKHLDPLGILCLTFLHFGWAKPVPINTRYFKNSRRDFALTALAGPASNLLLGLFSAPLFTLFYRLYGELLVNDQVKTPFLFYLALFFLLFHQINLGIAVFNLIPIPPLDGSRILNVILPPKWYYKFMQCERYIYWGMIIWLIGGRYVSNFLLSIPFVQADPILSLLATLCSLSNILGYLVSFLSEAIFSLWNLIFI